MLCMRMRRIHVDWPGLWMKKAHGTSLFSIFYSNVGCSILLPRVQPLVQETASFAQRMSRLSRAGSVGAADAPCMQHATLSPSSSSFSAPPLILALFCAPPACSNSLPRPFLRQSVRSRRSRLVKEVILARDRMLAHSPATVTWQGPLWPETLTLRWPMQVSNI